MAPQGREEGKPVEGDLRIFAGSANPALAEAIARELGLRLGALELGRFSDGEVRARIDENVRGADVFVVQSTCGPVNEHLMELLVLVDAFRRASARRITAVMPYFGYARQDRKARGREPISAKLVANLLATAGVNRVLTMELHVPQIQGFFDLPVDHLLAGPILAAYFKEKLRPEDTIVIAPDIGAAGRALDLARRLGTGFGIIDKRRPEPNVSQVAHVVGKVRDMTCLLVDDIIDTGGSVTTSAEALLERGAKEVYACCTHPVLSGGGAERLQRSPLREIVVTDTIPLPPHAGDKFRVLSVAPFFAEAIQRIHDNRSVSELFR